MKNLISGIQKKCLNICLPRVCGFFKRNYMHGLLSKYKICAKKSKLWGYKPSRKRFNIFLLYFSSFSDASHEVIAKWEDSKSFNQLNKNANAHIEAGVLLFGDTGSTEAHSCPFHPTERWLRDPEWEFLVLQPRSLDLSVIKTLAAF